MSISIEGIDELIEYIDDIADGTNIEAAVGKACSIVERAAKKKAPKKSGDLRKSITSKVEAEADSVKGTIYTPVEYAPYVEYGTGLYAEKGGRKDVPWAFEDEDTGEVIWTAGQRPKPFLRPALLENRKKIKETIKGGIKK